MTKYQEQRIRRLEEALAQAQKFVRMIATDSFIYGEKFSECMWCESDTDVVHEDDCPVKGATLLYAHIEYVLRKHAIQQGG